MLYLSWEKLFGPHLNDDSRRRKIPLSKSVWQECPEDTYFNGHTYAKGSKYKVWESRNFGWCVFSRDSKTPDGHTPGKFIHKF